GRTFKESFQRVLRGLEVGRFGFGCDENDLWGTPEQPTMDEIRPMIIRPNTERTWYLRYSLKAGMTVQQLYETTGIDPWFGDQMKQLVECEEEIAAVGDISKIETDLLRRAKRWGYSDRQLATLLGSSEMEVRSERK